METPSWNDLFSDDVFLLRNTIPTTSSMDLYGQSANLANGNIKEYGLHLPIILSPENITRKSDLKVRFDNLPFYAIDTGFNGDILISEAELLNSHRIYLKNHSGGFLEKLLSRFRGKHNRFLLNSCYPLSHDYACPTSVFSTFNGSTFHMNNYRANVHIPNNKNDISPGSYRIRVSVSNQARRTLLGTGFLRKMRISFSASFKRMSVHYFKPNS